ncbi:MAG: hypothetical protein ACJ783_14825 [Myxococcales bacterium]
MPPLRDPDRKLSRAAARVGVGASALAVFTCGWFAMSTTSWPRVLLFSALALVAGAMTSAFSRLSR